METVVVEATNAGYERRLAQSEADIKALAESVERLMGVIGQLKAVQQETLAVMRQLLSGRSTSGN